MTDSTHRHHAPLSRLALRTALVAVLATFAAATGSATARADGDPASDVLAQQTLFLPQDAGVPARQQTQIATLLQEAAHAGYPIRVALIASPTDLGSVTALWRQPQSYAKFLGQELALVYHGPLLVVMPTGLGLYQLNRPDAVDRSTLAHLPTPQPGTGLGTTALNAIQKLATAAGHAVHHPKRRQTGERQHDRHHRLDRLRRRCSAHRARMGGQPPHKAPPANPSTNHLDLTRHSGSLNHTNTHSAHH